MPEEIRQPTVGQIREQETDVLYGLVLLFTYGQLALIVWDMLVMIPGFAGLTGLQDPGRVHSIGGITSMYLGLVGAYIGRNAWRKYKNKDDAEQVPQYMFLRIRRGYFYVAMWGTLCFVAYMLKAMTLISRMPYELVLTATGVMAELFGDKVLKGIVSRQTVQEIGQEIASADHHGRIMDYVESNKRITNVQCREITGLGDSQANAVLSRLEKDGKLEQVGDGRYAYYRLKGTND